MESNYIRVLGSADWHQTKYNDHSCYTIDDQILIDACPSVVTHLLEHGVDPINIPVSCFTHLFSHVWSCEDFETTKADPDIYHRAACAMGYPEKEVLFLDDNLNACQTAKQAGMQVCGVYDDSSKEYAREIKAVSDYYIDDFSQLLSIEEV